LDELEYLVNLLMDYMELNIWFSALRTYIIYCVSITWLHSFIIVPEGFQLGVYRSTFINDGLFNLVLQNKLSFYLNVLWA